MKNKVILTYYDIDDKLAEESLWIESLDNEKFQVKNIPFFAPNIAYDDIITVEHDDGLMYFEELIEASEHSTVQIVFFKSETIKQTIIDIETLNCSWEGMDDQKHLAIDIPPTVSYQKVKEYLDKQLDNGVFDYKEACLSETHSNKS